MGDIADGANAAPGGTGTTLLTEARLRISRMKLENDLKGVLRQAAEISSQALKVARVGVWLYHHETDDFVCEALFDTADPEELQPLPVVKISSLPVYCRALDEERFLALYDARTDPRTIETLEYLKTHGISSMLDAGIYRNGQVAGVVCHEHRGEPRHWTSAERQFAATVADLVTTFIETQVRLEAQQAQHALELQLRDARRLEAMCRFAAGVSHDLGNLLAAVTNGVAMLRQTATPERAEVLGLIFDSVKQSMTLARQLMSLQVKEPAQPVIATVDQVEDDVNALLALQLGDKVTLKWEMDPEAVVWADLTQLEQVIFNLVLNARDAMPDGGTIVVRLRPSESEGFVAFEVIDTGVGIAPADLERIFDPFFTTRAEGTGIGLSIVEQFTSLHGGDVRVSSVVGEGTTFTVNWPTRPPRRR
jgi:two-component system cell cycle sensor histidine kinase/response regulator CckA